MRYPLVGDLAAHGVPVAVTCRVLGFSTRAFYKWKRCPVSQRDWDAARLTMARVGACGDNAAMESFFALLQKNVLNRKRWATREELRLTIVVWIEKTYPPHPSATQTRPAHTDRV